MATTWRAPPNPDTMPAHRRLYLFLRARSAHAPAATPVWDKQLDPSPMLDPSPALEATAQLPAEPPPILAPISLGELIDKITILDLKNERLQGAALANVQRERDALHQTLASLQRSVDPALVEALHHTNASLWEVEDQLRDHERQQDFGATFVALARSVYRLNDERASLKKRINLEAGSLLVEEKSYAAY